MKYDMIYLVDDFDMVNFFHRILFRQLGLEEKVKVFTNPEKALRDLRTDSGKEVRILMMLDLNMPEMGGFEFLDHMVAGFFPGHIDVIVVTSSVADSDRAMANGYPQFVRDYVTKPLKLEKLRDIITSDHIIKKSDIP